MNMTLLFSILQLLLPERIEFMLKGWKTLTLSLKTCIPIMITCISYYEFSTMKEVVDGVLYHATLIT